MTGDLNISFITATIQLRSRHDIELQHAAVRSHNARLAAARKRTNDKFISRHSISITGKSKYQTKKIHSVSPSRSAGQSQDDTTDARVCCQALTPPRASAQPVSIDSTKASTSHSSPWHWSKGTRIDDFECIPGSNLDVAPGAIDFLMRLATSSKKTESEVFGGRDLLEQMSMYGDLFHVIVATMSGIHCALASPEKPPVKDLFIHKERALFLMRKRLLLPGAAADDGIILPVLIMALMELGLENSVGFEIHHKHIRLMIAARGKIENLRVPEWIQNTVRRFERWNSPDTSRDTVAPADVCTYPPSPPSIEFVYWLAVLPEGIRNVAVLLVLSEQTLNVVERIAKRERFVNPEGPPEAQALQDVKWIEDLRDACPALELPDDSKGAPLDKLLCLAILQHCINKFHGPRHLLSNPLQNITASLLYQIPRVHVPVNIRFRDCLIWIWLIAIQATSPGPESGSLTTERTTLLRLFLSKFPGMRRWTPDEFISLGRKFFWTKDLEIMVHHLFIETAWSDRHQVVE